jgi:nucleotide-binding universal stress UspA family protein
VSDGTPRGLRDTCLPCAPSCARNVPSRGIGHDERVDDIFPASHSVNARSATAAVVVQDGDWDPAANAQSALDNAIAAAFGLAPLAELNTAVIEGTAAGVLLAASVEADMLVLGSRGHGGFAGLLLGSVSAACAEHAKVPVLVIHGTTPPPPAV